MRWSADGYAYGVLQNDGQHFKGGIIHMKIFELSCTQTTRKACCKFLDGGQQITVSRDFQSKPVSRRQELRLIL
jgi:hypothetical protein